MEKQPLHAVWSLALDGSAFAASVPGDILIDAFKAGKIPDPYFDENAEGVRPLLNKKATYTGVFTLTHLRAHNTLIFEGIDTFASISLNGHLLGQSRSMFLPFRQEVTPFLFVGKNTLVVEMSPVSEHIDDKEHGWHLFNGESMQMRKPRCHFGWDWAPKLWGYGIYLPVYLTSYDELAIEDAEAETSLDGTVVFHLSAHGAGKAQLFINDVPYGDYKLKNGLNAVTIRINHPRLWWPHGEGEPTLYRYRFVYGQDQSVGRFAFRSIALEEKPLPEGRTSFALIINGRRIFAKGSNWVPLSNQTGAIPDSAYQNALDAAVAANFNMLRVWGGGIYEKELFYDLCDDKGILIFQDAMYACQKMPIYEGFLAEAEAEADYQLKRLRRHPCVALLSGGNELYYHKNEIDNPLNALLSRKAKELAPSLPFIPSSPYGKEDEQWDALSGDSHRSSFEEALLKNSLADLPAIIDSNRSQFYSECTILGCTRLRSLRRFIPAEQLTWPLGPAVDYHFVRNPYACDPKETFLLKETRLAEGLYGPIVSLEDFCKKSMLAHAEILSQEASYARSNPECAGFMNWMFNDNWGCGTWSLIDAYGEAKPAYYALKRAFEPVLCRYVYFKGQWRLAVSNSSPKAFEGMLSYGCAHFGDKSSQTTTLSLTLQPGEQKEFPASFAHQMDYAYARLAANKHTVSEDFHYFNNRLDLGDGKSLSLRFVKVDASGLHFRVQATSFVRGVRLSFPKATLFSDNDFDLLPGESRLIVAYGRSVKDWEKCRAETTADTWRD